MLTSLADSALAGRPAHQRQARLATKSLLMPLLAASVATDPRAASSPLHRSTLTAQAGAWAGDVALLGAGTRPFLVGVTAFTVGHVASVRGQQRVAGPGPLRRTPGAWAYSVLLAALAARASHLDPALPAAARRCAAVGAWTFLVSDTLLATRTFVLAEPSAAVDRAVMLTYTGAQLLLAEAAART